MPNRARLTIDRPARTMIVWLALSSAVVDMAKDAEPEFRILVEDLPLRNVVTEMSGDECIVLQHLLDERADFLAAGNSEIVRQDTMTCVRELIESVTHQPLPPCQCCSFTLLALSLSLQQRSYKMRDDRQARGAASETVPDFSRDRAEGAA
jgi:hypothetical protein